MGFMRVAIIGGCQAVGLGSWIAALMPGCSVLAWHVNVSPGGTPEEIEKRLGNYDFLVTQIAEGSATPTLELAALRSRYARVEYVPLFVFPGFHPDITSCGVSKPITHFIRGPLAQLQSTIIVASFQLALEPARAVKLFNTFVFEALGYLETFAQSRIAATKIFSEHGFEIDACFDDWLRDGAFMYTNNHPHIRVLGSFAHMVLQKAGYDPAAIDGVATPKDSLESSVRWPTHPAVARRAGVPAEPNYGRAMFNLGAGEDRWLDLPTFVEQSYAILQNFKNEDFINNLATRNAIEGLSKLIGVQL